LITFVNGKSLEPVPPASIIHCDFSKQDAYIYAATKECAPKIKKEAEAYEKIGIDGGLVDRIPFDMDIQNGLVMKDQAQFHPLKFLDEVADNLLIYEHTRVTKVLSDGKIITDKGSVKAESVVITTHYPFINVPGYYFFKMHQERQYVVALEGRVVYKQKQDKNSITEDNNNKYY